MGLGTLFQTLAIRGSWIAGFAREGRMLAHGGRCGGGWLKERIRMGLMGRVRRGGIVPDWHKRVGQMPCVAAVSAARRAAVPPARLAVGFCIASQARRIAIGAVLFDQFDIDNIAF